MSYGVRKLRFLLVFIIIAFLCVSDVASLENNSSDSNQVNQKLEIPKYLPTVSPTSTPRIFTPTPTATIEITPTPTAEEIPALPTYYIVKSGDTLQKIAEQFNVSITYIAYKNQIQNLDLIFVGQELYIENPPEDQIELYAETEKLIVVKLSTQTLTAYEFGTQVAAFDISSGVPAFPTITGTFYVYAKYEKTRMQAYDYDIPDVPWTMYYYQGYAIHGAPWHNNFGTPMSHGCVNLEVANAEWIYNWAPYYTIVKVIE